MRITQVLNKQIPRRLFRQLWENRRTIKKVRDIGIPALLVERGIPVYDGLKVSKERDPVDISQYLPRKQLIESEIAYLVGDKSRLLEGPLQAQILTNTLGIDRLPQEYQELFYNVSLSEDEVSWFTERLKLLNENSAQFKLPHKIDEKRPWHRFPRDFAPGVQRDISGMTTALHDFVCLSESKTRKQFLHELSCQFLRPMSTRNECVAHVFQGIAAAGTALSRPLSPLGEAGTSKELPTGALPSMYPALPEMDLKKVKNYAPDSIYPQLSESGQGVWLDTLFITHPVYEEWPLSEKMARTILNTYTFAAARAAVDGNAMGEPLPLEKRTRLQAVFHDLDNIGFVVFQLNTLAEGKSGDATGPVRNQVWFEYMPLREGDNNVWRLNERALRWMKAFYGVH